jgi:hypothetical protein
MAPKRAGCALHVEVGRDGALKGLNYNTGHREPLHQQLPGHHRYGGSAQRQRPSLQGFTIDLGWSAANNGDRFESGDEVLFDLGAPGGLLADNFNVANGDGYYAAAHVQGIGGGAGGCSKVADSTGGKAPSLMVRVRRAADSTAIRCLNQRRWH